jgi:hypothetical protein
VIAFYLTKYIARPATTDNYALPLIAKRLLSKQKRAPKRSFGVTSDSRCYDAVATRTGAASPPCAACGLTASGASAEGCAAGTAGTAAGTPGADTGISCMGCVDIGDTRLPAATI